MISALAEKTCTLDELVPERSLEDTKSGAKVRAETISRGKLAIEWCPPRPKRHAQINPVAVRYGRVTTAPHGEEF